MDFLNGRRRFGHFDCFDSKFQISSLKFEIFDVVFATLRENQVFDDPGLLFSRKVAKTQRRNAWHEVHAALRYSWGGMDDKRYMLRHFLAALAYRTQKAVRDAPEDFAHFRAGNDVRTPMELVRHMTSVLGYARTFFVGGSYRPEPLLSMQAEIERFHEMLESLREHLDAGTPLKELTEEQLLQGQFSDAMTHAGQLAMLRRLHGRPVRSENFIYASISPDNLTSNQPQPVAPDDD